MKDPEEVLKDNPGSVIFARYGDELARDGKIEEALEVLNKGIEANPYYAAGYSVLAEIYSKQESNEKSAELLEKALSLEPQSPRDMFNLGKYLTTDQPDTAKVFLWAANRYEPDDAEVQGVFEETVVQAGVSKDLGLSPETERALSDTEEEVEIPGEFEKTLMETSIDEEDASQKTLVETESSISAESDEPRDSAEPEAVEIPEEPPIRESEEDIQDVNIAEDLGLEPETEDAVSELDEGIEVLEEFEETAEESMVTEEPVLEESEEKIVFEAEKHVEEIDDDGLPGYSDLLENSESMGFDSTMKDQEEAGEFNLSKLDIDVSTEKYEEPVLSEEERAELLSYEEASEDVGGDSAVGEIDYTQTEDSETSLSENLSGELSKDEINALSITDTEPDDSEMHLQNETREGIDYSDILYGQEPVIESDEAGEALSEAEIQPEYDLGTLTGDEDISPPETESKDAFIDTEDVIPDDLEKQDTIDEIIEKDIVTEEEQEIVTGEYEPVEEKPGEITDTIKIVDDMIKSSMDYEQSFDEKDILEIEKASLEEIIDDYVDVLTDFSKEHGEESIDSAEETTPPEMIPEGSEVESDMMSNQSLYEEMGEETVKTDEATPTMAEIFVSQGLITRAIEMYNVLLERNPEDQKIISRLEELQKMLDDQSDNK